MFVISTARYRRDFNPRWANGTGALAIILCPGCGKESTLSSRVHAVADDGKVTPSYVCPHPPCNFHEWVRLDGWTPAISSRIGET